MASNSLYLSVMTPCVCSMPSLTVFIESYSLAASDPGSSQGQLNVMLPFNQQTLNQPILTTLTLNVSGLTGTEDEITLAGVIYNQLSTYLIQTNYNYQGFLAYAEEVYPASWQTTRN